MIKLDKQTRSIAEGIVIAILLLCGLALLLYFLYAIRTVFVYVLLASVIALIGRPLVKILHDRLKFSSTLSAGITMLIFVLLFSSFFYIMVPLIFQQTEVINSLNTDEIQNQVREQLSTLNNFLLEYHINFLDEYINSGIGSQFHLDGLTDWFSNILGILSQFSIGSFSILFISFFFLKERYLFHNMLMSAIPDKSEGKVTNATGKIKNLLSRYFIGLTLQVLVMFTLYYSILFFIIGVEGDTALLIAFMCALCNIIPYIGPIIGFFIFCLLSMSNLYTQGLDFNSQIVSKLYWIIGGYLLAQLVDNFVNQPLIYSKSVKSHPLEIFLVIIIGGLLANVLGVILAVPAYTVLRVILKEFFYEFKIVKSITKNI